MLSAILHRKLSVSSTGQLVEDDDPVRKKKFVIRLLIALHNSGNLVFRTEKLAGRVANTLGLYVTTSIFPRRMMISFQQSLILDPRSTETHTFALTGGLDMWRLHELEQLVFDLSISKRVDFEVASRWLDDIENSPPLYGRALNFLAHFTMSYTVCAMFYGGNAVESAWAAALGSLIYGVELLSERLTGLSEIVAFASAFLVAFIATILDTYAYRGNLCLFAVTYGGVVWLLPGYSITISLIELYSGMTVYGATRLIHGISQASQVGFGLALGHAFVAGDDTTLPESFVRGCREPLSSEWGLVLMPILAFVIAAKINTSLSQMPGMILTASVAMTASFGLGKLRVSNNVIPFVCAICVTTAARLYAWWHHNERPLIFIISGLIILVPGGVGVKGAMNATLGDTQQGLDFTFRMLLVGISLAIGIFTSLVPTMKWFRSSSKKHALATLRPSLTFFGDDVESRHVTSSVYSPFREENGERKEAYERRESVESVDNPVLIATGSMPRTSSLESCL